MKLFIAAIIKDEQPGLLEWIAYHKVLGVEGFIIADNGSRDGSSELLGQLARLGIVDLFDFPNQGEQKPQLPAYQVCLSRAKGRADLLAFIDADEFLLPQGDISLSATLERLFSDDDISALALNWANFGSSGHLFADKGLVIERFTQRAKQHFHANHNIKSIVRPDRVTHFYNPHQAALKQGRYIDALGRDLNAHPRYSHGVSAEVCWEALRVNHYVVKSFEEFITGKYRRGSAATANRVKHKAYFQTHDRNDEPCDLAARLAPAVKVEIARLQALMDALPAEESPPVAPTTVDRWQQGRDWLRQLHPGKRGGQ